MNNKRTKDMRVKNISLFLILLMKENVLYIKYME